MIRSKPPAKDIRHKSYHLTVEASDLLHRLSGHLGISRTAVVEIAVRRLATMEGIDNAQVALARRMEP